MLDAPVSTQVNLCVGNSLVEQDERRVACRVLLLYFTLLLTCLLALLHLSRTKSVSSGSSSDILASSRCDARSSTVGLPHASKYASECVSK